jgi:hypothetical protein
MPLSLTCACGARFELDETLAGQNVICPECQQALRAPALARPPLRTSHWALASVVLALTGAFTVIGTVAAVVCGVVALVRIQRQRDRLAGAGLAAFGLGAGVVFTALTLFALSRDELFGLGGELRERMLAEHLDFTGDLKEEPTNKGFAITRPSRRWGRAIDHLEDPALDALTGSFDLLLVQAARYAFVDVRGEPTNLPNLDDCRNYVLDVLRSGPVNNLGHPPPRDVPLMRVSNVQERPGSRHNLPDFADAEAQEFQVDLLCGGRPWTMLIRIYRTVDGRLLVVRGFTPRRRFDAVEPELRQALDSFKVLPVRR